MSLNIDMTTIVASAITASILSISNYLTIRYVSKIVDKIEKSIGKNGKSDKP